MKSAYQIIRRPVITEKGLGIKENQNTLVFQVAPKATKTEIKEAVQSIFKVKLYVHDNIFSLSKSSSYMILSL